MPTSKTYTYKDLVFPLADGDAAEFTVEFLSDGNEGTTTINVPGPNDKEIQGPGSVSLGTGSELRTERTIAFSVIYNAAAQEDEISINYLINGKVLLAHTNPKSESASPRIMLVIQFPQP